VRIHAGSVVVPLNNTIRIAEDWAVVDLLSGGRAGLALASGWHQKDFALAPHAFASRRDITFAAVDTLRRLWSGEEVEVDGVGGNKVRLGTFPRPVQRELPLWLTAAGSPETFVRAGELGVKVLTALTGNTLDSLRVKIGSYRAAFTRAGHADREPGVCVMLHTFVGDSRPEVRNIVHGPLTGYLRTNLELHRSLAQARNQEQVAKAFKSGDADSLLEFAFERYFQTSALMGTPEDCIPTLTALAGMGVTEVACLLDFGVPAARVMESLPHLVELKTLYAQRCAATCLRT
jgi:natural product biosynthesis luciferase-like monooxygenase protein